MSDKDPELERPRAGHPEDADPSVPPDGAARSEAVPEDAPGAAADTAVGGDAPGEPPVVPGLGGEGDGAGRPVQRKARRRRALRWVAGGMAGVVLLGGGIAAWLYQDLRGNIRQEHVKDRLGANRPAKLNKSLNILLVGSDTREGENGRYGSAAEIAGARSDTTILLHLSPNRDEAVGISFPRDSMVRMPACRREQGADVPAHFGMINEAFANAGPTCTWKTLESLTGIHIDHFVQVDFVGFKRMVDALGGVEICLDRPVDDPRAELHLKAGRQTVKGDDALGYVRARYSLGDGSDLERIQRQQKFMASVVNKASGSSMLTDPAKTYRFLKAATESVTTDDELDLGGMRKIANGLKDMSAGQVRFVTVPVEPYAPDPNRVQWDQTQAKALFEAIRHDNDLPAAPPAPQTAGRPVAALGTPEPSGRPSGAAGPTQGATPSNRPKPPVKVRVTVVAAGATQENVTRIVQQLKRRGFDVQKKVEKAAPVRQTSLSFAPSAEGQATRLARIAPTAVLTPDPATPPGTLRLVLGTDGLQLLPPKALDAITGGVKPDQNICG
ncbi:LytR family transcriptional regulator [Actinomadura logoneensis]|uniref:LytR family transcriptional regulator n=1 Tax=Actinomadura logoneensis TaxID=2293572 RepID=A0A372JLE7_9ACTN|nr:LCP family protein [Actinomadura logoneensis]RFU40815.1 LytR family transcriptional regulator [Actinomadura logoneensis]